MKSFLLTCAVTSLFLLAPYGQVFATNYICIQNSSSIDFNGSVVMPDGHAKTQDTVNDAAMPAHSGNLWSTYCVGVEAIGYDAVVHTFLKNKAKGIEIFIDWENPAAGAPGLRGNGITVSGGGVDTQYIVPGGGRYVVRICDPGMKCVDNPN